MNYNSNSLKLVAVQIVLRIHEQLVDVAHLPALLEQHLLGRVLGVPVDDVVSDQLLVPVLSELVLIEVSIEPLKHLKRGVYLLEPVLYGQEQLEIELPFLLVKPGERRFVWEEDRKRGENPTLLVSVNVQADLAPKDLELRPNYLIVILQLGLL